MSPLGDKRLNAALKDSMNTMTAGVVTGVDVVCVVWKIADMQERNSSTLTDYMLVENNDPTFFIRINRTVLLRYFHLQYHILKKLCKYPADINFEAIYKITQYSRSS